MTNAALKFFEHIYFGTVFMHREQPDQEEIRVVGMRAYRDLSRTMRYVKGTDIPMKWGKSMRWHFAERISTDELAAGVHALLAARSQEDFDREHRTCCENILDLANSTEQEPLLQEKMTYGQAQKWVNMTMKYLYILGYVPEKVVPFLHVPVDDFMLEAVWSANHGEDRDKDRLRNGMKNPDKLPFADSKSKSYGSAKILRWSKWDAKKYEEYQAGIRNALEGSDISPIVWEGDAWMLISDKRGARKTEEDC